MVKIQYLSGIPPHDQRILSHGAGLFGPQTLSQLHIEHESTVQVMRRQSGMISSFSFNDMNDPLVRYLMLPEEERQVTPFPLEAIHQRHPQAAHKFTTSSFTFQKNCNVLSACHRAVLAQFLDFMWSTQMAKNDTAVDMKVVLPDDLLVDLLRPFADRCQDQHEEQWSPKQVFDKLDNMRHWRTPKIALRMTKGPTKACINFHQDGDYATYTMQLALNGPEQYQGGKLCFFSNNRLEVLTRPAGSLVGHPRELLHAVTALTGGVRKSLFLVDESNGLGDKDVITASQEDVSAFGIQTLQVSALSAFFNFPARIAMVVGTNLCARNAPSYSGNVPSVAWFRWLAMTILNHALLGQSGSVTPFRPRVG
ncbi:expressed unknown protein [Seminavis robusta]|uniref:Ubiquitin-like domain-containing protein n=1 Tax=Seminavis robusta TaxID=568900 RepID=A0A9N8DII0_9STRA|nr:expressed unknown protein [Seminavis robusta]|eukprot:Sro170_g075560.1 n/a (366) ;mRNA; r:89126-90223